MDSILAALSADDLEEVFRLFHIVSERVSPLNEKLVTTVEETYADVILEIERRIELTGGIEEVKTMISHGLENEAS